MLDPSNHLLFGLDHPYPFSLKVSFLLNQVVNALYFLPFGLNVIDFLGTLSLVEACKAERLIIASLIKP